MKKTCLIGAALAAIATAAAAQTSSFNGLNGSFQSSTSTHGNSTSFYTRAAK
jgi:hypothetical protein